MYSYTAVQWLFFFYFYCFFGWCFESTVVSVSKKKLVNRGFMRGPFLPLYGSGAIMMLLVSMPFQDNIIMVYIAGCIGATVLEYVTGVVMEALFKVRYWDYSKKKFNFQGHICLTSTLAWGGLTILMTEFIHKPVERFVLSIPYPLMTAATFVLTAFICADFALSFKAALDLRDILVKMDKAKQELMHVQKRLDVIIAVANEDIANRKEELARTRDELLEGLTQYKDEITEGLTQYKDGITEGLIQYKDGIAESLSQYKDGIAEELAQRKEEISENWELHKEEFSDNLEMKIGDLKDSIEKKLDGFRKLIMDKPSDYADSTKEELKELTLKYHRNADERDRLGRLRDFFQRDLIRANPSMSSGKFHEALEELKKAAYRKKQNDADAEKDQGKEN